MVRAALCLALCALSAACDTTGPIPKFQKFGSDLPQVTVDHDDFEITQSCRLRIEDPIVDAKGDGVILVRTRDIHIDMDGQTLRGSPEGTPPDLMAGTGIRITAPGVVLANGTVCGFKVGVHVSGADGGGLAHLDVSDNFGQRLKSTPLAEDGGDWLWPHSNDNGEWRTNYGAGILLERCTNYGVMNCKAWHGQNGLVMDRVNSSQFFDNDFSFLSGWGIAMWRSSDNTICRNALDFCVRGYSHGVYNRGQDSAGILCFEQCSRNLIALNSVTHGGDGFFGFAGKEALGEVPPRGSEGQPLTFDSDIARLTWYRGRGCNENMLYANDFSHAVAHGIELTFSFHNLLVDNMCVGDAICGVWGGYSQHTMIKGNRFEACGSGAYGGERGGVNIEHGAGNLIWNNSFSGNACGVRLWWDEDAGLLKTPWAQANDCASADNAIHNNTFDHDTVAIELRKTTGTFAAANTYNACGSEMDTDQESLASMTSDPGRCGTQQEAAFARLQEVIKHLPGKKTPIGARAALGGREAIIIGPAGPYDWTRSRKEFDEELAALMRPYGPGVEPQGPWQVRAFATTADPRTDHDAFHAAEKNAPEVDMPVLMLPFGAKGPSDLVAAGAPVMGEAIAAARIPAENFGLTAKGAFTVQPGCWRVRVISDDGVRVFMDGKAIIDNWTWHVPTEDTATFAVDVPTQFVLEVDYFELTGHAVLQLFIEPCPAK